MASIKIIVQILQANKNIIQGQKRMKLKPFPGSCLHTVCCYSAATPWREM